MFGKVTGIVLPLLFDIIQIYTHKHNINAITYSPFFLSYFLPAIKIFIPNSRSTMFCYGICEWWRTVFPFIEGASIHWRQNTFLWCRDNFCVRLPAWKQYSIQRFEGNVTSSVNDFVFYFFVNAGEDAYVCLLYIIPTTHTHMYICISYKYWVGKNKFNSASPVNFTNFLPLGKSSRILCCWCHICFEAHHSR